MTPVGSIWATASRRLVSPSWSRPSDCPLPKSSALPATRPSGVAGVRAP
ncbi:MAG: hypothetical protein L6W00_13450 [Lentisphaeria bacterium]|nr:MAG: hypothetical protein L6W00_13450 [Lentisphaeria bacterium]